MNIFHTPCPPFFSEKRGKTASGEGWKKLAFSHFFQAFPSLDRLISELSPCIWIISVYNYICMWTYLLLPWTAKIGKKTFVLLAKNLQFLNIFSQDFLASLYNLLLCTRSVTCHPLYFGLNYLPYKLQHIHFMLIFSLSNSICIQLFCRMYKWLHVSKECSCGRGMKMEIRKGLTCCGAINCCLTCSV